MPARKAVGPDELPAKTGQTRLYLDEDRNGI